jgi:hypothetical protein
MKGVPITDEQKVRALKLYSEGRSYEYIFEMTGVSAAAMTALVAERAKEDPDLTATHELVRKLRDRGAVPETHLRAIAIDDAIHEAGSSLDEVESVVLPIVKKFGNKTVEVCERAEECSKVVEETGYTHEQLLAEHPKKVHELDEMNEALSSGGTELKTLVQKITTATSRLGHLLDLERIKNGLQKIGGTPRQAAETIEKCEKIVDRGLTIEVADRISIEVERLGAKVADVPRRIAELLAKHGSLESAVDQTEKRLTILGRTEKRLQRSVSFLRDQRKSLVKQCRDLRVNLSGLRSAYNGLSARYAAREEKQVEMFANRKEAQDRTLAARYQASQSELDRKAGECQEMQRKYQRDEQTHIDYISALERKEIGIKTAIASLTETMTQMTATIDSYKALSGFLWKSEPAKMDALFAIFAKENVNPNATLSNETRAFLLDGMLGMMVEDVPFWPQSMGRYLTNPRRSLAVSLGRVWREKLSLDAEIPKLEAILKRQREALAQNYPTWKILEDDPAYLARFLGGKGDKYLIDVFSNLPVMGIPRLSQCLRKADEVQKGALKRYAEDQLRGAFAKLEQSLMKDMADMMGPEPIYVQAWPSSPVAVKDAATNQQHSGSEGTSAPSPLPEARSPANEPTSEKPQDVMVDPVTLDEEGLKKFRDLKPPQKDKQFASVLYGMSGLPRISKVWEESVIHEGKVVRYESGEEKLKMTVIVDSTGPEDANHVREVVRKELAMDVEVLTVTEK